MIMHIKLKKTKRGIRFSIFAESKNNKIIKVVTIDISILLGPREFKEKLKALEAARVLGTINGVIGTLAGYKAFWPWVEELLLCRQKEYEFT